LLPLFLVELSSIAVAVELDVRVWHGSLSIHMVVMHFPLMHIVEVELVIPLAYCNCCWWLPIVSIKTIEYDNSDRIKLVFVIILTIINYLLWTSFSVFISWHRYILVSFCIHYIHNLFGVDQSEDSLRNWVRRSSIDIDEYYLYLVPIYYCLL
jgi:hypothetical protein